MEWFDFAVYGYFAPVIGQTFFPSDDKVTSPLAAWCRAACAYSGPDERIEAFVRPDITYSKLRVTYLVPLTVFEFAKNDYDEIDKCPYSQSAQGQHLCNC